MTYALVDNSTLTAVQRVIGQAPIRNRDTISGDLAALESFVQTLLFYDEVLCLDDYKPQHTAKRKETFSYLRFIDPSDHGLIEVAAAAKREAGNRVPRIRGGQFEDEAMKPFFEMLKMNAICTWDMRSSSFYLTLKCLGYPDTSDTDRFSKLSAAIYAELSDSAETRGHWSTQAELIGSKQQRYTPEFFKQSGSDEAGVSHALEMFIASLNWLSYKAIFYSLAGKHFRADTCLHPIRHAYQVNWMQKSGILGADFTGKLVALMSQELQSTHESIVDVGRSSRLNLNLPLFSAWLLKEAGDPKDIPAAANELKKDPTVSAVRSLLREIRVPYDEGNLKAANQAVEKWRKGLIQAGADLRARFGVKTQQGTPLSPMIQVLNVAAAANNVPALPDFGIKIPTPTFLKSDERKAFGAMFKSITSDLVALERLGEFRDGLASRFAEAEDIQSGGVKTENPKYRWASSDWKRPM